jgi:hypothetical protein
LLKIKHLNIGKININALQGRFQSPRLLSISSFLDDFIRNSMD